MGIYKHQNETFTTLGSDRDEYCFIITRSKNPQIEIHKRFPDGCSYFDERTFITAIPVKLILEYVE